MTQFSLSLAFIANQTTENKFVQSKALNFAPSAIVWYNEVDIWAKMSEPTKAITKVSPAKSNLPYYAQGNNK